MKKRNNIQIAAAVGLMSILVVSCQKDELTAPLQVTSADNNAVVRTFDNADVLDRATSYTPGIEDAWPSAFQSEDGTMATGTNPRLVGKWKLTTLYGQPIDIHVAETPSIRIDSEFIGFGGCNRISGSVYVNGAQISFLNVRATRMYCPAAHEVEQRFLAALRSAKSFTLSVNQLRLSSDRGEVAILQRVTNQPRTPRESAEL